VPHWIVTHAFDLERVHEIYHDDVVVEFPQFGERILTKLVTFLAIAFLFRVAIKVKKRDHSRSPTNFLFLPVVQKF